MTVLYIVTSRNFGEWDTDEDRLFDRVFSTREKADGWIGPMTEDYSVLEWTLDDIGPERPTRYWEVVILLDHLTRFRPPEDSSKPRLGLMPDGFTHDSAIRGDPYLLSALGRSTVSHEHALELATAVRDRWLAANEAPTSA